MAGQEEKPKVKRPRKDSKELFTDLTKDVEKLLRVRQEELIQHRNFIGADGVEVLIKRISSKAESPTLEEIRNAIEGGDH